MSKNIGDAVSIAAYDVRQRVKKIAVADLRSACIRLGGKLTAPFLRLEKEIDDFSSQSMFMPSAGDDV